jgi:hypothetical protein
MALTAPVMLRRVASGFRIENVRCIVKSPRDGCDKAVFRNQPLGPRLRDTDSATMTLMNERAARSEAPALTRSSLRRV